MFENIYVHVLLYIDIEWKRNDTRLITAFCTIYGILNINDEQKGYDMSNVLHIYFSNMWKFILSTR